MIRVLLVGNYRPDRQFSMLGFESALTRNVPPVDVAYTVVHPAQTLGRVRTIGSVRKWLGYFDKYILFPRKFSSLEREVDVVHILDQGNGMWVPKFRQRPVLVTCHDLMAMKASLGEIPGWSVSRSGQRFQELIALGLRQSSHIVCDSKATLDDVKRILKVPANNTSVLLLALFDNIYETVGPDEVRKRVRQILDMNPNGFLVHVGGNQPYKNRSGLLELYTKLSDELGSTCPGLVLAGHKLRDDVRDRFREWYEPGKVTEVVLPETRMIYALLKSARGLVYPSLAEGFGLPILEAQACGCPVVCSNRGSLPEVGGSGALYFDPTDHDQAIAAIKQALGNPQPLVEEGFRNLGRFSTNRMIGEYINLYRRVAGQN